MTALSEQEELPEPFEVHWTAEVRELRPPVSPGKNAPLLMRLNRNPFGLKLPWIKREAYMEPREGLPERESFSAARGEAQHLRERPGFASPAEDRYVLMAPPTLRQRRSG